MARQNGRGEEQQVRREVAAHERAEAGEHPAAGAAAIESRHEAVERRQVAADPHHARRASRAA